MKSFTNNTSFVVYRNGIATIQVHKAGSDLEFVKRICQQILQPRGPRIPLNPLVLLVRHLLLFVLFVFVRLGAFVRDLV